MLNIDEELKKIKEYLDENISLDSEIVPNYDFGNKVSVKTYEMIDNKKTPVEYSFFIKYYEKKDNYRNASYLLHCDWWHSNGGRGGADKYESLEDFKNAYLTTKLLEFYGTNKATTTLFDEVDDKKEDIQTEELTLFDLDTDETEDNQLSIFDDIDPIDNNVDLKDLMSYGIDDYYMKNLRGKTFGIIREELNKIPKYAEYYKKLRNYLKNKLPNGTYENTRFDSKPTFITDSKEITIKGNRRQSPIFCYIDYEKEFE